MQRTCPNCGRSFRSRSGTVTCRRCGHSWSCYGSKAEVYMGLGGVWLGACKGLGEEAGKAADAVGPVVKPLVADIADGLIEMFTEFVVDPLLKKFDS